MLRDKERKIRELCVVFCVGIENEIEYEQQCIL